MDIITQNPCTIEDNIKDKPQNWLDYLKHAQTDPQKLIEYLGLNPSDFNQHLQAKRLFSFRVPQPFIDKMQKGNPCDPLLLQVIPHQAEFLQVNGFSKDPLLEQGDDVIAVPGILHKYHNRLLMMVKGGCAVNCRYCFRRHFPYAENKGNKQNWHKGLIYIAQRSEIEEVIFSGGDPLMAKDHEIQWLVKHIEGIPHVKSLRIHTRLPIVIPQRITYELCQVFAKTRLNVIVVTHINHAQEIDALLEEYLAKLKKAGVTLLNQSVLLKGINDNAQILKQLSDALFQVGVLPYYLHLLDKVEGASHFYLSLEQAQQIYAQLLATTSGYLVPKLAREIANEPNKTLYTV